MIQRAWMFLLMLFVVVGISGVAVADLSVVGTAAYDGNNYQMIYDSEQELIWLDYTNTGMRWPLQTAWAASLNEPGSLTCSFNSGISVSWQGEWRLPKSVDGPRKFSYDGSTTAGFHNTSSELGHLYYRSLKNRGYYDTNGNARPGWGEPADAQEWGLKNTGPFKNLQSTRYWSSTGYAANPIHAWAFNTSWGMQMNGGFKAALRFSGMAVRPARIDAR